MLRLLIIEFRDWTHPNAGGAEQNLLELARRLVTRGWQIDYLCDAYPGAKVEETRDGIRIFRRGKEWQFPLVPPLALRGALRKERYDLILEGIDKLPFFLPWLAPGRLRRRVAVFVPHLLGETAGEAAGFFAGALIRLAEALIPFCYRKCAITTGSESSRKELLQRGLAPERLHLVPYGLDHTLYRPGTGVTKTPYFLYVGRLRKYKALDVALRAFAHVAHEEAAIRFIIAGQGDDRARLERLTEQLGIAARVDFRGFVSNIEKVTLMQSATALVYPSRKEGWGLPVLEAAACGTPAVASDVPGLRDGVRHNESGVLVPFGDVTGFAVELLRIHRNKAWRAQLSEGGLRWAAQFDWDRSATALAEILEAAAKKG